MRYRLPQLAVARFTGRHAVRTGALWGLVFGLYVYDNAIAYNTIAPDRGPAARAAGLDGQQRRAEGTPR